MNKKLLIVVDYQNDFVIGSLGFPAAAAIEDAVCAKIESMRTNGADILFTFDTHFENYSDTQEGRFLPVAHCIDQCEGWQLYGKVANLKKNDDFTISKYTFGSVDLAKFLCDRQYDEIELIGVVTDICVISNAVIAKAALPEAEITIDAACVASNDPVNSEKALDIMAGLQMNIINR